MAEKYMFFNSTADDRRRHQASDMADYWQSFLSSGLIHEDGQPKLGVIANGSNRNITIPFGRALIQGHLYINTADLTKRIENPDSLLDRIDRVVLRYDNSIENRFIKAFILEGETAAEPVPPELTREGDIYEISLAQIRVVAGKSYVDQSDVIDERLEESVCGLASSIVSVPTDIFDSQFQEYMQKIAIEWQTWFNTVESASYITGDQFTIRNREVDRQLANVNAVMDIDNRAIGNTGKFYDLFDGTNEHSSASSDYTKNKLAAAASAADTSITITGDAASFVAGQEITVFGLGSHIDAEVTYSDAIVSSIEGNVIHLSAPLGKPFVATSSVSRSMKNEYGEVLDSVSIENWADYTVNAPFITDAYRTPEYGPTVSISNDLKWFSIDGYFHIRKANGSYSRSPTPTGHTGVDTVILDGGRNAFAFYTDNIPTAKWYMFKLNDDSGSVDSISTVTESILVKSSNKKMFKVKGSNKAVSLFYTSFNSGSLEFTTSDLLSRTFDFDKKAFDARTASVKVEGVTGGFNVYDYDYIHEHNVIVARCYDGMIRVFEIFLAELSDGVTEVTLQQTFSNTSNNFTRPLPIDAYRGFTKSSFDGARAYVSQGGVNDESYVQEVMKVGGNWVVNDVFITGAIRTPAKSSSAGGYRTFSRDNNFMLDASTRQLFLRVGNEYKYLSEFPTTLASGGPATQLSFTSASDDLLGGGGTSDNSRTRYWVSASSVYPLKDWVLRYDFEKPVENLAGWLFAEAQKVEAGLSLVDNTQPENYLPLSVTKNGDEYEFLEVSNLYTKEKATLKLTISGKTQINKLIGAIE